MIFFFSISVRLLLSAVIKNFVPIDFDCRAKVNTLLPTYNFFFGLFSRIFGGTSLVAGLFGFFRMGRVPVLL